MNDLERHFDRFRKSIIGFEDYFSRPYKRKKNIYSDWTASGRLYQNIEDANLSLKPGWIRLSFHTTMLNKEVMYVMNSISALAQNFNEWSKDYKYVSKTNEFEFIAENHSCKNKKLV